MPRHTRCPGCDRWDRCQWDECECHLPQREDSDEFCTCLYTSNTVAVVSASSPPLTYAADDDDPEDHDYSPTEPSDSEPGTALVDWGAQEPLGMEIDEISPVCSQSSMNSDTDSDASLD